MSLTTRFTRLVAGLGRRQRTSPAMRPTRTRLELERLESRLVLDISINFVGGINGGTIIPPMDPSETAGVNIDPNTGVADANWNNAAGNIAYGVGPLNDNTGAPVSGTTLTYVSNNTWATGIPYSPGDSSLMSGYLDSSNNAAQSTVVVVTGLSGLAPYNVTVYFSGDTHNGRHGFYTVPGLGTQEGMDIAPFDGSTYIQDSTGTGGNYLVFTGGTSDTLVLLANAQNPNDPTDNGFRAPIEGIQIVPQTPHPHLGLHTLGASVGLPALATTLGPTQGLPSVPTDGGSAPAPTAPGSPSGTQLSVLLATPANHDATLSGTQAVSVDHIDSVFADPVQSAF
jgi:hypothetical protein